MNNNDRDDCDDDRDDDETGRRGTSECDGMCVPTCQWCVVSHTCPDDCDGDDCPYEALAAEEDARPALAVVEALRSVSVAWYAINGEVDKPLLELWTLFAVGDEPRAWKMHIGDELVLRVDHDWFRPDGLPCIVRDVTSDTADMPEEIVVYGGDSQDDWTEVWRWETTTTAIESPGATSPDSSSTTRACLSTSVGR